MTADEKKDKITAALPALPINFATLGVLAVILFFFSSAAFAALGPTPALAARGHIPTRTIAPTGSQALSEPSGVAVNEETGDVYVVDKGHNRVERFTATGEFKGQFNGSGTYEDLEEMMSVKMGTAAGFGGHEGEIETGEFAGPEAIAVDNDPTSPSHGDVYVADVGHEVVDKFSATGEYRGQLTGLGEGPTKIAGVAVDSQGRVWVHLKKEGLTFELSNAEPNVPETSVNCSIFGVANEPGFAVDAEDDLYVQTGNGVLECGSTGAPLNEAFDPGGSTGLASELSSDDLYVDHGTALARIGSGGLVEGAPIETLPLAGGAGTGVAVDSATATVYVAQSTVGDLEVFTLEPAGPPTVESEAASRVTGESATLEAEVNPRSKPAENGQPAEPATAYHFEYTTEARFQREGFTGATSVPGGSFAANFALDTLAPVTVQGLAPGTTYRFRLLATNSHGTTGGQRNAKNEEVAHTFTTQTAGEFQLPDDRQWEMVSPPDKHGADIEALDKETPIQAAAAGGAMVFAADAPTEPAPAGYAGTVYVLSARGGEGGGGGTLPGGTQSSTQSSESSNQSQGSSVWSSRDLTLPHVTIVSQAAGKGTETRLFSSDLSEAIVQPFDGFVACRSAAGVAQPCLSEAASEQTASLQDTTTGAFTPLVTGCPATASGEPCPAPVSEHANVPAGTVFGDGDCPPIVNGLPQTQCGPEFVGATQDLEHVVLRSEAALTSPAGGNLYEWSEGKPAAEQLAPISILPATEAEVANGEGGQPVEPAYLGFYDRNVRNAISAGGTRVFWGVEGGPDSERLYMRDLAKRKTLWVDEALPDEGGEVNQVRFQMANSEGTRVFYTQNGGLYECAIEEVAGELKCATTELASDLESEGLIPGVSEDGSYIYFVASSASVEAQAVPGAVEGQPNLYVRHDGATKLIAVLSAEDRPDWAGETNELQKLTARVSPDGRWLAFMSQRELTGYDNRDAANGKPDEEVYLYHAPENLATGSGTLACASCNPTGARPLGEEGYDVAVHQGGVAGGQAWEGSATSSARLAADVPGWNPYSGTGTRAVYQPRYLSNSGRLFFNARDPLVPAAVNGTWDVYEFEPLGVPSPAPGEADHACSSSTISGSEVYRPAHAFTAAPVARGEQGLTGEEAAGCVALISSGESPQESAFLDASETGTDVFFMTTAQLSKADTDNSYDVYDAHECTSLAPCAAEPNPEPSECTTEASCKPAPETQPGIFGPSGSATFSGPGNEAPEVAPPPKKTVTKKPACRKGFVRKTVKSKKGKAKSQCVRSKPKRKHSKSR